MIVGSDGRRPQGQRRWLFRGTQDCSCHRQGLGGLRLLWQGWGTPEAREQGSRQVCPCPGLRPFPVLSPLQREVCPEETQLAPCRWRKWLRLGRGAAAHALSAAGTAGFEQETSVCPLSQPRCPVTGTACRAPCPCLPLPELSSSSRKRGARTRPFPTAAASGACEPRRGAVSLRFPRVPRHLGSRFL